MCRQASLTGGQLLDLAIECGQRLLKHLAMGGSFRAVQIAFGARAGQLQRAAALFGRAFFWRQRVSGIRLSARRFFLLGFY